MTSNQIQALDEAQNAAVCTALDYWMLYSTINDLCNQLEQRIATMDQRVVRPDKRLIADARVLAKKFRIKTEQIGNQLHPGQQLS